MLTIRALVFDFVHKNYAADQRESDKKTYGKAWMKGAAEFVKAPLDLLSSRTTILTPDEEALMATALALTSDANPYQVLSTRGPARKSVAQSDPLSEEEQKGCEVLSIRVFTAWQRKYSQRSNELASGFRKFLKQQMPCVAYLEDLSGTWCLYVTECGFLGRGHSETCEGDVVVLPYGSRQPMLLRPVAGREGLWRFMDFTHVNGLMTKGMESVLPNILPDLLLEERDFVLI